MEYRVEGIETTIPFFTLIMDHPDFAAARFDTGFIDGLLSEVDFTQGQAADRTLDAAIAAAAIMAFEDSHRVQLPENTDSAWKAAGRHEAVRGRQ